MLDRIIQAIQQLLQESSGSRASKARILPLLQLTSDLAAAVFARRHTPATSKGDIILCAYLFPLILMLSAFQL